MQRISRWRLTVAVALAGSTYCDVVRASPASSQHFVEGTTEMHTVSPATMARMLGGTSYRPRHGRRHIAPTISSISVREGMTPARAQGRRPTCGTFAATALLEFGTGEDMSEQCLAALQAEDPRTVGDVVSSMHNGCMFTEQQCPYEPNDRDRLPFSPRSRCLNFGINPPPFDYKILQLVPDLQFSASGLGGPADPVEVVAKAMATYRAPVAVSVYTSGAWWADRALTPSEIVGPDGTRHRINPADPAYEGLLATWFEAHRSNENVGVGAERFVDPEGERKYSGKWRDVSSYLAAARPAQAPAQPEIDHDCWQHTWDDRGTLRRWWKCPAHAVVVTGVDAEHQALEFKNSWGSNWKQEGYGYMSFDYFRRMHMMDEFNRAVVITSNRRRRR